jgi:hypothetical protein
LARTFSAPGWLSALLLLLFWGLVFDVLRCLATQLLLKFYKYVLDGAREKAGPVLWFQNALSRSHQGDLPVYEEIHTPALD